MGCRVAAMNEPHLSDAKELVTIAEHITDGYTFSYYRNIAVLQKEVAHYVLLRLQERAPERYFALSSIRHYDGSDDAVIAEDILSSQMGND